MAFNGLRALMTDQEALEKLVDDLKEDCEQFCLACCHFGLILSRDLSIALKPIMKAIEDAEKTSREK